MIQENIISTINQATFPSHISKTSEVKLYVICDVCADDAIATAKTLERQGWGLYQDFQFCPRHEEMV